MRIRGLTRICRYMYPDDPKDLGKSLSGATYVEDVNEVRGVVHLTA